MKFFLYVVSAMSLVTVLAVGGATASYIHELPAEQRISCASEASGHLLLPALCRGYIWAFNDGSAMPSASG